MQPALSGAAPAGSGAAASADSGGGKRSIRIKLGVSKLTGSQAPAPSRSLAQPSGDIDGATCLISTRPNTGEGLGTGPHWSRSNSLECGVQMRRSHCVARQALCMAYGRWLLLDPTLLDRISVLPCCFTCPRDIATRA